MSPPASRRAEVRTSGHEPEDSALVARALAGESGADEALFRRHAPAVLSTALRLLRNRAEAEDVVQETFIVALTSLRRLRDPAAVGGWLIQIAVRRAHRRFRRQRMLRVLGFATPPDDVRLEDLARPGTAPVERAELALVDRALDGLASEDRVAWILRHVEGHLLAEVAQLTGCSLATAKRRLARAEAVVRAHVSPTEPDDA